ncbi:MAG: Chromosome partitioning protein ParB [Candidatus Tokpelaia hoelldobleri]|uniref:Chromosome partitioning protein ParB n=1 Tax=Candidatus Tokpelaia hoelldobleri TaxID=1902579 RepID=A0A1U9JS96_9HYPH|nr:MAG: Chromosome partitioning protein ParB [Candidatus Tokpelaia hoelldoblerii]
MNEDQSKKRLGRGLAALIGDIEAPDESGQAVAVAMTSDKQVPIELVSRNPHNPRRSFAEESLEELAQSIREHGLMQPVVVRPSPVNPQHYELIAGERRWRAAQRAGLTRIAVVIRDVDDRTALELAIIENVQRADLNPVEEALGYQQLIDDHSYTQVDLAQVIGKSRSHVANTLRLLKLPAAVQQFLNEGALSAGHARCLITAPDPVHLAKRIVQEGLSVRQAEVLAAEKPDEKAEKRLPQEKDPNIKALEQTLLDKLGMQVVIQYGNKGGGDIRIRYKSLEQLDNICRRLQN